MLPALPVEEISARGADMAGAGNGTTPPKGAAQGKRSPSKKAPAKKPPATKAPATKPPATKASATPKGKDAPMPSSKVSAAAKPPAKAARLPVREGEDRWTEEELAEVRSALAVEITALREEIAAATTQIADGDVADGAGDDQADVGAKTYEREHEMALVNNARDLLAQNERAIERMNAGTYGNCESCGRPIGKGRLQAFPRATLCVTCKQREERR